MLAQAIIFCFACASRGETEQENVFKNPQMLRRLNDIEDMSEEDRKYVLFTIDALIQKVKIKDITA